MEQSDLSNQRHHLQLALNLVLQVGVASVGAGLAIVALYDPPRWLSVLLIGVGGLLTVTGSILGHCQQRRQARKQRDKEKRELQEALRQASAQETERERALEEAVQYEPCRVRLADPYKARIIFYPSEPNAITNQASRVRHTSDVILMRRCGMRL